MGMCQSDNHDPNIDMTKLKSCQNMEYLRRQIKKQKQKELKEKQLKKLEKELLDTENRKRPIKKKLNHLKCTKSDGSYSSHRSGVSSGINSAIYLDVIYESSEQQDMCLSDSNIHDHRRYSSGFENIGENNKNQQKNGQEQEEEKRSDDQETFKRDSSDSNRENNCEKKKKTVQFLIPSSEEEDGTQNSDNNTNTNTHTDNNNTREVKKQARRGSEGDEKQLKINRKIQEQEVLKRKLMMKKIARQKQRKTKDLTSDKVRLSDTFYLF